VTLENIDILARLRSDFKNEYFKIYNDLSVINKTIMKAFIQRIYEVYCTLLHSTINNKIDKIICRDDLSSATVHHPSITC